MERKILSESALEILEKELNGSENDIIDISTKDIRILKAIRDTTDIKYLKDKCTELIKIIQENIKIRNSIYN